MKKILISVALTATIAMVAHNANAAYCQSLGDDSHKPWDKTAKAVQDSAISGVQFHLDNPGSTPSASHESWLKFKEADGWKFGEAKDEKKKLHPCMVPYDELSADQKAKDYIFSEIVKSLLSLVDGKLVVLIENAAIAADFEEKVEAAKEGLLTQQQVDDLLSKTKEGLFTQEQLNEKIATAETEAKKGLFTQEQVDEKLKAAESSEADLVADNAAAAEKLAKKNKSKAISLPALKKDAVRPTPAEVTGTGKCSLAFAGEDDVPLKGFPPLAFTDVDFEQEGDHAVLQTSITFPVQGDGGDLSSIWMLDEDGKAVSNIRLFSTLRIGGGHQAMLPKRHLRFSPPAIA